ncbi:GMC family oxidoreductase [Veronia pacifica]|uniref:Glucose-methanol-choline oxidoreductase N-terminal domain-containing protein n=1 Tax=Veronia pacifica TaxID=1080227 RepID=A0A1C3ECV9_9GAMM|nr:GMC family oxidoreductase N-terminal domain-containing protein [Veronia pacifica]ODA31024.1 hypothetical protein A8L45_18365 [Veronia pacifica]
MNKTDFIVVGGGSGGCAVAGRLVEKGQRVTLLEAGPSDKPLFGFKLWGIQTPVASMVLNNWVPYIYNWWFFTNRDKELCNRKLFWPRGRGMGGSSNINAMLYIRGNLRDYDEWADLGNTGWSAEDILPYFLKNEKNERFSDSPYHSNSGKLNVADPFHIHDLSRVFVKAGEEYGLSYNEDFNGETQAGVGYYQVTQKDGCRFNANRAYLEEHSNNDKLRIETRANVRRILFDGDRAVGIEYIQKGKVRHLFAEKEVILASGAIQSPHLLMLSGIGPRAELEKHDIKVVKDLPGVGENLQDHLTTTIKYLDKSRTSINLGPLGWPFLTREVFKYLKTNRGLLSSSVAEGAGFEKTSPEFDRENLQYHFLPLVLHNHGRKIDFRFGFSLHLTDLRPKSRGRIYLKSADPDDRPQIETGYLTDPDDIDMKNMVDIVKKGRELMNQPAFEPYLGEELTPGKEVQSDEQLEAFIRQNAETIYHPVGTCKMGVNDEMAVVDPELKVYGIQGLRVADASIMPLVIGGNTNAPTMVIGEKCADYIARQYNLPLTVSDEERGYDQRQQAGG